MNWIKRVYLSIVFKKHILRVAISWANDWYTMSVMDDGSGRNDFYWVQRKPSQENALSELVGELMSLRFNKNISVKEYKEKVKKVLNRIL